MIGHSLRIRISEMLSSVSQSEPLPPEDAAAATGSPSETLLALLAEAPASSPPLALAPLFLKWQSKIESAVLV